MQPTQPQRSHPNPHNHGSHGVQRLAEWSAGVLGSAAGLLLLTAVPSLAQQGQTFMRNKNTPVVTPQTSVEPRNCQQARDGAISCDTQLVNPQDPANKYRTVESPSRR